MPKRRENTQGKPSSKGKTTPTTTSSTTTIATNNSSSDENSISAAVTKILESVIEQSNLPSTFKFDAFQIHCFECLLVGHDLMVSLRTGGGKFLILALAILFCGATGVVIIAIPLDMLAFEHKSTLINVLGVSPENVAILKSENFDTVVQRVLDQGVNDKPFYVFGHPGVLLQLAKAVGRNRSITVLGGDEIQLVKEWGGEGGFIPEWGMLGKILQQNNAMRFVGVSGSSTHQKLVATCETLNIHPEFIKHGDMGRPRTSQQIVEDFAGLPRRNEDWKKGTALVYMMETIYHMVDTDPAIPPSIDFVAQVGTIGSEDFIAQVGTPASDDFVRQIGTAATHRGVIVWCENKKDCLKVCSQLNVFIKTKESCCERQHAGE